MRRGAVAALCCAAAATAAAPARGGRPRLPAWGYQSWDDKLPVLWYGSNCTGFDSAEQLRFNARHDLLIYLFPVNQGRADCGATVHCDPFLLAQADANRRAAAGGPPVLPYVSSMPLALAFYDAQAPYMPSVTPSAHPYAGMYLRAANGSVLGPVGNTDLWFDFRNATTRSIYVEQMVARVAGLGETTYSGWTAGTELASGSGEADCKARCAADARCQAVRWVSAQGVPGHGDCTLLADLAYSNADGRWSTWVRFAGGASPAAGFFFDDVDWGACGAIRQYSDDPAITDDLLAGLYDATVETMVDVGRALNAAGQVPIFAVTNGFFDDPQRGGTILPNYSCPRPYEAMFGRLQDSGVAWMRFYEFQWPKQGGGNCDLVVNTAAREGEAGVPLVVHGDTGGDFSFQLAAFLLTAVSNYSYFGASSGYQDRDWAWHSEYDRKWGAPIGSIVRNGTWYYRELRNTHVHLNCAPAGGAHLLSKAAPRDVSMHEDLMRARFPAGQLPTGQRDN